jgi:very-short-patch-repair endonuclease
VANQQLALITTRQLRAAEISKHSVVRRCKRGILHRVHRRVYLYGSRIMLPGAPEFAAVLACGARAWICSRSAMAMWGLVETQGAEVEVVVAARECRSRPGIRVHRVQRLDRRDVRLLRGIPVTAPARTLLDFAHRATPDELERAIAEAHALGLVNETELNAAADRAPRHPGVAALRAELRREAGPRLTRREGERRLLKLLREAHLPQPLTNTRVVGFEADFLWPDHKLIVEFDGYQFHGHRAAFERDRKRDAAHVLAGYRVIRITWRQLTEEPLAVVATIARALGI